MRLCLALLLLPFLAFGQRKHSIEQKDSVISRDVIRFADAMGYTYTAPVRWDGKDWLKVGGVVLGTVALTLADDPVRSFATSGKSRFMDGVSTVGYHYGKPYTGFALTSGLYLTGIIFKSEWAKETGLILGTSLFSAGLMESVLKPLVGRARPFENAGNYDITFLNKEAAYHSFPSGHASMAFTISMVMARRVPSVPIKIFFYSLATATAANRIYSDQHWVSDVAFGAVIAWFCSDVIIKRMEKNKYRRVNQNFRIRTEPFPNGIALKATF
jgi:membrane-associated phospholipid phosphatase